MKVQKPKDAALSPDYSRDTFYKIDPDWYENHGISLKLVVHQRRCPDCRAFDAWNEVQKKSRRGSTTNWQKEMREIMKSCSRKDYYISSQTPMVEAVFRVLLQNGNRPMSVTEIGGTIGSKWALGMSPRALSISTLERVLMLQNSYGIQANPLD